MKTAKATKPAQADASAQLQRLLALVPRIADGEEHSITEMARLLGVDTNTVVRDLLSVGDRYGEPGGFVEALQVFIDAKQASVKTNHFLRPMRLTVPELHALDLGLAMLRAERPPSEWSAIDRARERIAKTVAHLPSEDLDDASNTRVAVSVDAPHLGVVRTALSKRRKLEIAYQRGDATRSTKRTVRPYRLILAGPVWYLVAHCERSEGIRVFRADRIQKAELLADTWSPPDLSAIDEQLARGDVFVSDAPVRLRVRFSAKVARWIEEHERGDTEPDGSFVVEYPMADLDWAVRHVLRYGPEAEILEPPEARQAIRGRLKEMLS